MATNGKKQKPVYIKKFFPVQVAVFEFKNEDGRPNFSVSVTRSFRRDEESEWETTEYLSTQDLLPASRLLVAAYEFIQGRLQKVYQERREEATEDAVAADPAF